MTTASPATLRHSISLDSLIAFGYDRTPVGRRELAKDTLGRVFGYIGSILCGARFVTGDKRHPASGFTRQTSALGSKGIFAFPGFLRLNDVPLSTESSSSIDDFLTPQCQAVASSQDTQPSCWKPFEHLTPLDLVDEAYMAPIPWPNEQRCFSGGEPLIPSRHSIHQRPHSKRVCSGFHREDDSCYPLIYSSQASQSDTDALQLILALNDGRPSFYTFEQPPRTVLDLGCGDGAWILHAKNVWKDTQFVGQDLVINGSTMSNDRHKVQLVEGNFLLGLPYATATFDYIRLSRITMGIPCWLWEPFLREVHRVLTPDGIVEVIDDKYFNVHVCRCSQCNESGFLELETQFRRLLGNRHVHEIHRIIPVYRGHFFGTVEKSIHEVGISFKSQCLESGKQPKPRMKSITTSRLQATFPIPRANTPVSRPTSPISRVASPIPSLEHSLSRSSSPAPPSYEEATRRKRRHSNLIYHIVSGRSTILRIPISPILSSWA
ncbi:hypothetical protein DL93DRAFT_1889123 [Clavulina sp. PMI_390]|nr:hypothetical protein DL93DRAFT_1889123 [Clavulina sp. PMI_390]